MPKLRKSEQELRELALLGSVERAKAEKEYGTELLATRMGISASQLRRYKQMRYQNMSLEKFAKMARLLELTPDEVCRAVGLMGGK